MLRFSPFIFKVVQNFKGNKRRTSDLRNLARSRGKTRSRKIAISGICGKHKNGHNFLNIDPTDPIFFLNCSKFYKESNDILKSHEISQDLIPYDSARARGDLCIPLGNATPLVFLVNIMIPTWNSINAWCNIQYKTLTDICSQESW